MNPRSRLLAVLALVGIFLAGGVTGWLLRPVGRPHGPPRGEALAAHLTGRLSRELALTPEQVTKAAPIIAETSAEVEKTRRDVEDRIGKVFDEMHTKLAALLTPDQLEKLAKLRERRRAMREAHPGR